ncbi:hypothetical protein BSKO_10999 [Bryopsis sp. KO-2023]|nr:hypothetical protein BSKO_10999 [Bryopsis sp. KO-2023]
MSIARSLSADNLPELRESEWLADVEGQPRLVLYNDGTGCVLELRRPGDGPAECDDCENWRPRTELPKTVARVVHKVADFIADVAVPCHRYSAQTLLGSLAFGGIFLAARWLVAQQTAYGPGTPIFFDGSFHLIDG